MTDMAESAHGEIDESNPFGDPVDLSSIVNDEDAMLAALMENWFAAPNMDLIPVEEGGEDLTEENEAREREERSPSVTSRPIETMEITSEDYEEGPQRYAFDLTLEMVRNCYIKSVKDKVRIKSIEWVFIPNIDESGVVNKDGITFEVCCQALGVRPNLIRLRLQFEFYSQWLIFPQGLPFVAEGLPESLCAEILYSEDDVGLQIAKKIWSFPSISTERLESFAKEMKWPNITPYLDRMDEKGIIGQRVGYWYFIGRNPNEMSLTKRNEFKWSKVYI